MKNIIIIFLLFFISKKGMSQLQKIEIQATGLTCSMCSLSIFKQLQTIKDIDSIYTDIKSSTYIITLRKNNQVSPNDFKEKIESSGFFIGKFIATANVNDLDTNQYIIVSNNNKNIIDIKFQIIDKGFVTNKEFKTFSKKYKDIRSYISNNEHDFHIKLIEP